MKHRYIQRLTSMQSRRKQIYYNQTNPADIPSITDLIKQVKLQQEKEKHEKE